MATNSRRLRSVMPAVYQPNPRDSKRTPHRGRQRGIGVVSGETGRHVDEKRRESAAAPGTPATLVAGVTARPVAPGPARTSRAAAAFVEALGEAVALRLAQDGAEFLQGILVQVTLLLAEAPGFRIGAAEAHQPALLVGRGLGLFHRDRE